MRIVIYKGLILEMYAFGNKPSLKVTITSYEMQKLIGLLQNS